MALPRKRCNDSSRRCLTTFVVHQTRVKRKKRVLEELPIAPPLEPRQPTAAELAVQEENDQRILTLLKFRLGPILAELKRKHKRFTKPARVSTWDPTTRARGRCGMLTASDYHLG